MATRDQALFLDTLLGMQRALKRKADDSDSDSSIDQSTNRGNKLKRRARLVREGRLEAADGLAVLSEPVDHVDHAGFRRAIVRRNPPLVDDDGYAVNSDDGDDDDDAAVLAEAEAAAADANPYATIQLEALLAPLVAVADLPTHPTLARPFTSKALVELATQGRHWMQKENGALWAAKPLLSKLCGDHVRVDCALLVTPDDAALFDDDDDDDDALVRMREEAPADGVPDDRNDRNDRDDDDDDPIHPLYLPPAAARTEPDLGLPPAEAEDVRRLLQLWVQKQDEVARGARALHEGLLRANRLRATVLGWSKAEAHTHSGPDALSDGEDWYDPEAWGLTEVLKKGHDEEEEDTQQPKKTRNRK